MKFSDSKKIISDELRAIIDTTSDLMFVKDMNFVYIAVSPNYAHNCVGLASADDVIGKTDFELFDPDIAAEYRRDDEQLIASGKFMEEFDESYPLKKPGDSQSCLTNKILVRDNEGRPVAILGQYHSLSLQLNSNVARRYEIDRIVNKALSSTFLSSIYLNLVTDKFIALQCSDYAAPVLNNCKTNEEGMEAFICNLVKPDFQEKMRAFCDVATLGERLRNQQQIECIYHSNTPSGWCRTCFIPTERDENGNVTNVLLIVSCVDEYRSRELGTDLINKKSIATIFNEVPGGIVLYDWTGTDLKVIRMSRYYQDCYGYSLINSTGSPDFTRVHPDDREGYINAVKHALKVTHSLEYVFRVLDRKKKKYGWAKINAISRPYDGERALVYCIYTDVTKQKEAELSLEKKQASLEAALNASDQLCCEYDSKLHTLDCFTKGNIFKAPDHMEGFPESMRELNIIHPDDLSLFTDTVHAVDEGLDTAHCDIRAMLGGEYRWFSCTLNHYLDPVKERNVAILTMVDATARMKSIKSYEEQLRILSSSYENSLTFCNVNLTRDTYEVVGAEANLKNFLNKPLSIEETMNSAVDSVIGEESKRQFKEIFDRKNMLEAFAKGQTCFRFEHLLRTSPTHIEWIRSGFDLIKHPVTGDVVGVCHTHSINTQKISNIMLFQAMEHDYDRAFVAWADSGEYYLFETDKNEFCSLQQDFWGRIHDDVTKCLKSFKNIDLAETDKILSKENILTVLENSSEFVYNYSSNSDNASAEKANSEKQGVKTTNSENNMGSSNTGSQNKSRRMQLKVVWHNKEDGLLAASIRNMTDLELMESYRHASEHDPVTGLYNRATVFAKCRELLNEHPDKEFCMFHGDLRNFHLYNAFFGEEAGNELLKLIASYLVRIVQDYECCTYGRIEADVFCVFFPLHPEILEKHIKILNDELYSFRDDFLMETNLGLYLVKDRTMPIEAMFARASIAAKSHKCDMFNFVSLFDENMERVLEDNHLVTSEMQKAIDTEEFQVYLQPKYSLRTEKIVGAEALVRWIHPKKGMISPGKFIPVFERNGFITTLDRYMWEHVAKLLRRWKDEGRVMLPVSVNVSRLSMYIQTTVPFLKDLVKRYDIEPRYFELELTESAYMDDPEDLKRMLRELKEAGFVILMDDFGSGYSSLNTLRDLPVDVIKLDMKFLSRTISQDERATAVLSSVVRMSKLLHLPIVAEGVEKRDQADYLCSIGCEYVQGFLFARPMPVQDFEETLQNEPCEVKSLRKDYNTSSIMKILSANNTLDGKICDGFAMPMAVIESDERENRLIRANDAFQREFGLQTDLRPTVEVFRERVDERGIQVIRESIRDCIRYQKSVKFAFVWHGIKGDKTFAVCLDFIGTLNGISSVIAGLLEIGSLRM